MLLADHSRLCQSLRKPYNLKSNDYLEECAQSLAAAAHNDTDFLMPYFVHIQRLSEEVCRAFDYDASYELPPLDSVRTEILVKAFQNRFKRMEAAFPQEVWSNGEQSGCLNLFLIDARIVSLKISFYRLRIYINEVGFHASPPSDEDAMSDQSCLQSWYYSQERNDCLVSCLAATKEYLDQVLSLSDNNFLDFTLIKFIYLIYAVEILGSFATKYNDRMINAIHVQKSTDFDYYIDGLSEKLLRSIAATKGPSANPYLSHLIDLFQRSKVWYAQMQLDPAKVDYCALGRPEYTFMEIMPMLVSRCMDFSIVGKSSCGSPNSDQMWTELMSESSLDPSYITMNGCS